MASPVARKISQAYLFVALLLALLLAVLPYSVVVLFLLVAHAWSAYRPLESRLHLALTFATLLVLPLALGDSVLGHYSVLLLVPALPLLDWSLRQNAHNQPLEQSTGWKATGVLTTLVVALLAVLVVSVVLSKWVLAFAVALLSGYLAVLSICVFRAVPGAPLQVSPTRLRVVAGHTSQTSVTVESKARIQVHAQTTPVHSWLSVEPQRLSIGSTGAQFDLTLTPPLSGPSAPGLQVWMTDPWGLWQRAQQVHPVQLYVIPRARYAEWLARRFLSQSAAQPVRAALPAPTASPRLPRRGVEYLGSHLYQPGDSLRDLDWKRMCKMNQIVVKEYGGSTTGTAIVAANMVVKDPEEADTVAYDLITLVLTLARLGTPMALAAYNHRDILLATEALDPREVLKRTLGVAHNMTIMGQEQRFLQAPDIRRLARNLAQLEQVPSGPAKRLAALLGLEVEAIRRSAEDHPATRALARVAARVAPPATIAVVSARNHDMEALAVALDNLSRQGYETMSAGRNARCRVIRLS
ncbi:MAG: hypothetical protein DRI39_02380 [Chloroflexi bacterium]|nr:MAG: hypothetical protein DRI39_02380 [Chloroflexota bacterium]RLC97176.1 MAG: hypothetical protein DRI40_01030 [Chloroflexota bacterium]